MKELILIFFVLLGVGIFAGLFDMWYLYGVALFGILVIVIANEVIDYKLQKR